ncbi:hypothetical protein LCGC14_0693440 [marine sediment metagenome]|uniref:Acetyltransferase n=1 Tax=marine sediment metagenome TaxID=412755 RepID=A0A0F9T628_9ZZZZ|nr:hypothetical protein [bacterium]
MSVIEEGIKGNSKFKVEVEKTVELPTFDFFKINFLSFLVPLYICLGLFILFEYLFINLLAIPIFIQFLLIPGMLLLFYYIYLIILIEFVGLWIKKWNKKSPPQEGVFTRNLEDKTSSGGKLLKYYHKRGFIIKFPLWLTSKSPFPWLMNRTLRKIGHNTIGKNVIYCNAYAGLEFTNLGDNVFIYPSSGLSSHAVNSIFGKISILEIRLGKNTTLYPGCIVGPNALTEESYVIYPNTILHKNWRGKPGKSYYQGSPGRPL